MKIFGEFESQKLGMGTEHVLVLFEICQYASTPNQQIHQNELDKKNG